MILLLLLLSVCASILLQESAFSLSHDKSLHFCAVFVKVSAAATASPAKLPLPQRNVKCS
jgi:hypothetical protein